MCEKTKEKVEKPEICDEKSWEHDQKERDYYYDDAHGYEIFDAEADDDDEEIIDAKN